jgi:transcriptional regulator with XRE-family HTH domain
MPKPSAHLPEREVEICNRLREFRESLKWSMPDFARELGITRDRLASYEYGRAPLRFDIAARVCTRFHANPAFLANNWLPQRMALSTSLINQPDVPPQMLFSEAYDRFLKRCVEPEHDQFESMLKSHLLDIGVPAEKFLAYMDGKRSPAVAALHVFDEFVREHVVPASPANQAIFFAEMTYLLKRFVGILNVTTKKKRRQSKLRN